MYNTRQLSRTIYEATFILKQKIPEKVPKLNFPSYIKDRHDFNLEFHLPKFPPLPTCKLGLAFQLSPLKWYFCRSFSVLENDF